MVRSLCAEKPDLTRYILGAMSDADPLLGAAKKITLAENRYFRGFTQEEAQRLRTQLLCCTPQDLLALCPALDAVAEKNNYCIVGGKEQLDACEGLLDTVVESLE